MERTHGICADYRQCVAKSRLKLFYAMNTTSKRLNQTCLGEVGLGRKLEDSCNRGNGILGKAVSDDHEAVTLLSPGHIDAVIAVAAHAVDTAATSSDRVNRHGVARTQLGFVVVYPFNNSGELVPANHRIEMPVVGNKSPFGDTD